MRNFKKLSLVIFAFIFLFLFSPLPSLASGLWLSQSTPCSPKDAFAPTDIQTCEYNYPSVNNARSVDLKWNITTKGIGTQVCGLGCTRTDGTSCAGAMFKYGDNWGTSTVTETRLHPKDNVTINDPSLKAGNTYQAFCCAPKDPSQQTGNFLNRMIDFCQDNTFVQSQKMKVVNGGVGGPCEVPFSKILGDLQNLVTPTAITEENFKDWFATDDYEDLASKNGSGIYEDLYHHIETAQSVCQPVRSDENEMEYPVITKRLNDTLGKGRPVIMSLSWKNFDQGHSVIGLKFRPTTGSSSIVTILDPNGPKVKDMNCQVTMISGWFPILECSYDKGIEHGLGMARISIIDFNLNQTNALYNARLNYCIGKNNKFCQRVVSDYLENDYPYMINNLGMGEDGLGACTGWSDFVLSVGYLGDFVGTDYHPNDGKVVGKDCDANHYPSGAKKISSVNSWFANAWSAWPGIFK